MSNEAISVKNLSKSFKVGFFLKNKKVLTDVNFTVSSGSVAGFIGANGAGKTTVLKCLLQVVFPDHGEMEFFSQNVSSKEVRKSIGFLPERPYFHEFLTGNEFLGFHGRLMGLSGNELEERRQIVLKQVGLAVEGGKRLRAYSKGMLQRIGIGQALMIRPKLLILDEPMSGLDPDGRFLVKKLIRDIACDGTTVFFSSHLLHDAEELCDSLVCLKEGRVVYNGMMENLLHAESQMIQVFYCDQSGERLMKSVVQKDLQEEIDRLRGEGLSILEIKSCRVTLEEAVSQL